MLRVDTPPIQTPIHRSARQGASGPQRAILSDAAHAAYEILACVMTEESTTPDLVELVRGAWEAAARP